MGVISGRCPAGQGGAMPGNARQGRDFSEYGDTAQSIQNGHVMTYIVIDHRGRERGRGCTARHAWLAARRFVFAAASARPVPQIRAWRPFMESQGWTCKKEVDTRDTP